MIAAAKPLSGRSLYIQNGADKICYDVFYGTRKPAVMYLPCLFYPKVRMKEEKQKDDNEEEGGMREGKEGREQGGVEKWVESRRSAGCLLL